MSLIAKMAYKKQQYSTDENLSPASTTGCTPSLGTVRYGLICSDYRFTGGHDQLLHVLEPRGFSRTEHHRYHRVCKTNVEHDHEVTSCEVGKPCFAHDKAGNCPLGVVCVGGRDPAVPVRVAKQEVILRRAGEERGLCGGSVCKQFSHIARRTIAPCLGGRYIKPADIQKVCVLKSEFLHQCVHP